MPRVLSPSEEALADFDRIYNFIDRHNPQAAAGVLRKLDAAIQRLADQPKLGRAYNRERPALIEIIRVLHGRQNIPDILDEF